MSKKQTKPAAPAKSLAPVYVDVPESKCPTCQSTKRTDYHHTQEVNLSGTLPDGTVYVSITIRRTECTECGQCRIDRTYHSQHHATKESSGSRNYSPDSAPATEEPN